jgi:hypothetical protein
VWRGRPDVDHSDVDDSHFHDSDVDHSDFHDSDVDHSDLYDPDHDHSDHDVARDHGLRRHGMHQRSGDPRRFLGRQRGHHGGW